MATPNLFTILSKTRHLIKSNSCHFLSLSFLFLFPLCISLLISLLIYPTTSLFLSLLTLLLSLLATATISYSTSEAFLGRHVTLSGSLKSLSLSFFPLLATVLAVQLLAFLVSTAFALVYFVLILSQSNPCFWWIFWGIFALVFFIIIQLQVSWSLAFAVIVVESKWGFEPLRRSKCLIKGRRSTAFSLMLLFGFFIGFNLWILPNPKEISFVDLSHSFHSSWMFLMESFVVTVCMLYNIACNTVLYMYCKAEHGELSLGIAEEFVGEYVSIPIDDAKPPHVAYVA